MVKGLKVWTWNAFGPKMRSEQFFSNLEALRAFDVLKTAEFKFFS